MGGWVGFIRMAGFPRRDRARKLPAGEPKLCSLLIQRGMQNQAPGPPEPPWLSKIIHNSVASLEAALLLVWGLFFVCVESINLTFDLTLDLAESNSLTDSCWFATLCLSNRASC